MSNIIDLSGKTAFITGASRGIGEATARHLAHCGANVVLAARSREGIDRIVNEIGGKAFAAPCDVTRFADVTKAMALAVERFSSLDILVNNAGIIEPISRLEDSDPSAWGHVVDTNIKGAYHCIKAVYPFMSSKTVSENSGVIINISSGAATGALEGWSHYCATKAALLSLTRCAHKEWAVEGIRVVGLSPGTVATNMQVAIKSSQINPVSALDWSTHISPEWVARAIAWLTTDMASHHDGTDFSLKTAEGRKEVGLV